MNMQTTKRNGIFSRTWARYLNDDKQWLEKQRGILILAALVVAMMSFHSGINPPGGTITDTQNGRYSLGNAVQTEVDMDKFDQFVAYNTITMVISFGIFVVLVSGVSLRNKFWMWVLTIGTMFTVAVIVVTYWESLGMMAPDGYVNATSIWLCLVLLLGCGIVALIHTIFFVVWVVMKLLKRKMPDTDATRDQIAAEV